MPWLMKAEPDSRVVKGKDVKFSVEDFEKLGTSPWDGVRNHEAKLIMKERMKLGDKVLFYHSNCKVPGVFALATVAKEGYPDYTAWDESHPYYDEKTDKDKPTWYMVDVKFTRRLEYPPTLVLIKTLASASSFPKEVEYIGEAGLSAIKSMALVNRGVQPVTDEAYDAIVKLGTQGRWEGLIPAKGTKRGSMASMASMASVATDIDEQAESSSSKPASRKLGKSGSKSAKALKAERTEKPVDGEDAQPIDGLQRRQSKRVKR